MHIPVRLFFANIWMMKTITISQLRKNIRKHFNLVATKDNVAMVTRNNEEDAVVLMSVKEYNSLQETVHLLSTVANRQRLKESINQLQNKTHKFNLKESK